MKRALIVAVPSTGLLAVYLGVVASLYLAASAFAMDTGFAGLTDDQVRLGLHFVVYGSLAVCLARALGNWHLLAWLITSLLATGEEIHQLFVPFRFSCLGDWMTNLAGITMFLVIHYLLAPRLDRALQQWRRRLAIRFAGH